MCHGESECHGASEATLTERVEGGLQWVMYAELQKPDALISAYFRGESQVFTESQVSGSSGRVRDVRQDVRVYQELSFESLSDYIAFRDFWMDAGGEVRES